MNLAPNVVLHGGAGISDADRVRYVADTTERIKIFLGNRYEHFEPTDQMSLHLGHELQIFVWSRSTFVAE